MNRLLFSTWCLIVNYTKKEGTIFENSPYMLNVFNVFSHCFPDKSKCTDSAVNSATTQELLQHLESRNLSASDVTHLHQLKSLVLLQDIDRLNDALKQFQEHSMMPPGMYHSGMIIHWCSFLCGLKFRFVRGLYREAVNNCGKSGKYVFIQYLKAYFPQKI